MRQKKGTGCMPSLQPPSHVQVYLAHSLHFPPFLIQASFIADVSAFTVSPFPFQDPLTYAKTDLQEVLSA